MDSSSIGASSPPSVLSGDNLLAFFGEAISHLTCLLKTLRGEAENGHRQHGWHADIPTWLPAFQTISGLCFLRNASQWSSFLLLINDEGDSQKKEEKRCH